MNQKIKGFPGYVYDPETQKIIGPKGKELKPYQYPKCKTRRVSLYKNGKPTYVNISEIETKIGLGNDNWVEMLEFFQKREMKEIRKDGLRKKFEKFYLDEAIEEGVIIEKAGKKGYYIFNPDRIC